MTDGERWLLIDDDETFLQVLSRSLLRQGVESVTAHNRNDALRALEESHFNRCVLDLNLAGESGPCNYCQSCCNTTTAWRCWC